MAKQNGTEVPNGVVPGSETDKYATHYSTFGNGGYREVLTVAERNLIPIDRNVGLDASGLGSGRRRVGMKVYCIDTDTEYRLGIPGFTLLTAAEKLDELENNANWVIAGVAQPEWKSVNMLGTENVDYEITSGTVIEYKRVGELVLFRGTIKILNPAGFPQISFDQGFTFGQLEDPSDAGSVNRSTPYVMIRYDVGVDIGGVLHDITYGAWCRIALNANGNLILYTIKDVEYYTGTGAANKQAFSFPYRAISTNVKTTDQFLASDGSLVNYPINLDTTESGQLAGFVLGMTEIIILTPQ